MTRWRQTVGRLSWPAAIAMIALAAGCGSSSTPLDTACDASGCISIKQFSANIDGQLKGNVVGYVSTVGAPATIVEYGKARTDADPPSLPMGTTRHMNVASVSKVLTTIGVLQSLAAHSLTIDSKIYPYLPPDWAKGPNVNTISFRELLTHRAGFRDGDLGTYAEVKRQIADGVKLSDKATALYNNLNFAIFRILLPFMEGFTDPGPAKRAEETAAFYISYMRQHVFEPVGINDADCKPDLASNQALMYPVPPVSVAAHGADGGDWTLLCGGGGWVLTADNLYNVLLDLTEGNQLLTDDQKKLMNDNCLGWDCSVWAQDDFRGKSGLLILGNNRTLETFVGIFKGTVPVVVLTNSATPLGDIARHVGYAFNNAAVPRP